jgi:flagellar basal-body rod modification protein FlgD
MSSILDATTSAAAPTNTDAAAAVPQTLSASDFMQILIAEFQNQDPTAPTDPTQYASQMVEFSNLGQLQSINTDLQSTETPQSNLMQTASAYIGKEVVAPGNAVGVQNGQATSISYAPTTTDNYTALVSNSAGQQVASVSLGNVAAGSLQTFTWSPSSSIASGQYSVSIVNSKNVALTGLLEQGTVQSVDLSSSGAAFLNLGNLVIPASSVGTVAQPS